MANWKRQQGESRHRVGHWRSSSSFNNYSRKPPLDNRDSPVPSWERRFCATVGSVPWGKLLECKKYMNLHYNVLNWDDSAVKEAFDKAKKRYWNEMNDLPSNISLPDPNMYIDNVDWDSPIDPELYLELEKARHAENKINGEGSLTQQQLQDLPILPTGWEIEEEQLDPLSAVVAQGWSYGLRENVEEEASKEQQHHPHFEPAVEHEWQHDQNDYRGWNQREHEWQHDQNDYRGWNQRERYCGDSYNMGRGRGGGNGNRNGNWNGYNRRREQNMQRSNNNKAYHHGNVVNRGRGNYRGGRGRGTFAYDRAYEDKVPYATTEWKIKT